MYCRIFCSCVRLICLVGKYVSENPVLIINFVHVHVFLDPKVILNIRTYIQLVLKSRIVRDFQNNPF